MPWVVGRRGLTFLATSYLVVFDICSVNEGDDALPSSLLRTRGSSGRGALKLRLRHNSLFRRLENPLRNST